MTARRRDGLLALVALGACVVGGVRTVGPSAFVRPLGVGVGILGALAVEWVVLAAPALAARWERQGVPAAATLLVVVAVIGAGVVAPWLVGAAAWGLLTYLCLLGCVLAGWGNPVARAVGED